MKLSQWRSIVKIFDTINPRKYNQCLAIADPPGLRLGFDDAFLQKI
jgi:hypothetical protein